MKARTFVQTFALLTLAIALACGGGPPPVRTELNEKPREALLKALRAKLAARSYRMKNVQTGNRGMNNVMEGEYVAPGSYHVHMESDMGGKSNRLEMIVIGDQGYMKTPDGEWQKKRLTPEEAKRDRMKEEMIIEGLAAAEDSAVRHVGTEDLDGVLAHVYQYSNEGSAEAPVRSLTKMWVGAKEGLPRKVEMKLEVTREGERIELDQTTTYRDYNADLKVVAPN